MRIGEVARRSGLSTTTIRDDEDVDLLPRPARAPNGYRDHGPVALERLRLQMSRSLYASLKWLASGPRTPPAARTPIAASPSRRRLPSCPVGPETGR